MKAVSYNFFVERILSFCRPHLEINFFSMFVITNQLSGILLKLLVLASRTLTVPDADSGIEDEENSSSSSSFNQDRPTKSNRPKKEIEIDPTTRSSPSPPSSGPQEDTSSTPSADNQHHVINQLDLRKPEDPIKYSMDGVLQHNVLRLTHGSPPIRHSERLRKMAQEYADWLSEAR